MAFSLRNLEVIYYGANTGFTMWHYRCTQSSEAVLDVLADGYFQDSDDMMTLGDRIMVSATDGAVDLYVASVEPLVLVPMARTAATIVKPE